MPDSNPAMPIARAVASSAASSHAWSPRSTALVAETIRRWPSRRAARGTSGHSWSGSAVRWKARRRAAMSSKSDARATFQSVMGAAISHQSGRARTGERR